MALSLRRTETPQSENLSVTSDDMDGASHEFLVVPIPVEEPSSGEEYRTIVASQLRTQRDERHPTYQHHKENVAEPVSAYEYPVLDYRKHKSSDSSLEAAELADQTTKVTPQIQAVVNGFPSALGLCIAFSSEQGCEDTDPVPNIHNAGRNICETFSNLGYATTEVVNPSKIELLAVFEAISKHIHFSESYRRIVIYYTGHGVENCISLHDGYVNISYLKTLLWPKSAPNISKMPKVLIFDCCRGSIDGNSAPSNRAMFPMMYSLAENSAIQQAPTDGRPGNTLTLFSTPLLTKAYAAKDGVGFATRELVKLLEKPKSRSLADIFQSELYQATKKVVGSFPECSHMYPNTDSTLEVSIDVYQEKMDAMRPRDVKCVEEKEMSRISWTPPQHAAHHNLMKYVLNKRRLGSKHWTKSHIEGGATTTYFDVSNREFAGYQLSVAAHYHDADSSIVHGDILWLENVDISPQNVMGSKDEGGITLYWKESFNGDLFIPIGFVILKRAANGPGDWVVASDGLMVEDRHCTIASGSFETCRYKIVALYKNRTSVGKEVTIKDDSYVLIKRQLFRKSLICPCIALFLIGTFFLLGIGFIPAAYLARPHFNELAIASDVIDCDVLPVRASWFYSAITITELATDEMNDNADGFLIDVFSVKKSELKYHKFTRVRQPFVRSLEKLSKNRFIVPYNYYNRPYYMRHNSNITLQFDIRTSLQENALQQLPTEAVAYLFNGERHVNDFIEDSTSTPHYEQKLNILEDLRSTRTFSVKNNGYYYVAVEVSTDSGIDFMCNVSFNVFYIDSDDYNLTESLQIEGVGFSVTHPLDVNGRNSILCFIHNENTFDSISVHLVIDYIPGRIFAFESLLLFLCLFWCCLFGYCCYMVRPQLCRNLHHHHHDYVPIQ